MDIEIYLREKKYMPGSKYECFYYDEEEIEEIMQDIIPELKKNIGFEDNRSDKRFIVKFPDVYYGVEVDENEYEEFVNVFDDFCMQMADYVKEDMVETLDADENDICTNMRCGSYNTMKYIIPEITEENILELVEAIFDEDLNANYIKKYIGTVKILKDLEDNYVKYWNAYIEDLYDNKWQVKEK